MKADNELMDFEAAGSLAGELPWWGKVHCGDCLTLMGKMPAAFIGLIVTSPPYNLTEQHRKRIEGRARWEVAESRIDPRLPGPCRRHAPLRQYIQWQRALPDEP